jgi:hypothetical protein
MKKYEYNKTDKHRNIYNYDKANDVNLLIFRLFIFSWVFFYFLYFLSYLNHFLIYFLI